eukprot:CAMPEP_0174734044 /NCGR_PEP_ID=MMETSP1094-20130205/62500_1 /TAXON_ID=156173 /ORGANISM="Chrysochromulina brevifilum, Strain UTEX LB 985" /LENGTH=58 /DNA_ID=CAMNT_0015936791 /DNA_START=520 /DNA_END=692 /DNA_ORIENTATION=+
MTRSEERERGTEAGQHVRIPWGLSEHDDAIHDRTRNHAARNPARAVLSSISNPVLEVA